MNRIYVILTSGKKISSGRSVQTNFAILETQLFTLARGGGRSAWTFVLIWTFVWRTCIEKVGP